ncbi:class E sortase [Streptomyces albipurpureus]|uniref:Class E sortase n=1 Tax=Streptomyces albipurpureus TaxID=2897419 RepID=A0ABT0UQM1_9ACTN|nr:class E sortase [Streptomyces sp. CWNU-1]MCM2390662.1 class E sortase [Streptomyces sp. CWNU-1]
MAASRAIPLALTGALIALLAGCSSVDVSAADTSTASARPTAVTSPTASPLPVTTSPTGSPVGQPVPEPTKATARTETAVLSIPAIGVEDLRVVPYEGTTDDAPGTAIQNRGVAASPYGEDGGVGPGEIGNYLVTAHRLSAGGPLRQLPDLREGDTVVVTAGGRTYEYEITETRKTSFRSERSLSEQRAAVPGDPGAKATQAMITISTCATPEDDAAGNFWRDEFGNPEHRIDKIGVLKGE